MKVCKIAICITTHNRHEVLKDSLYHHGKYRPDNSMLFIIDDASDKPMRIGGNFYRFDENVGIAQAKNKGLQLAYEAGAYYIFNFDDDTYPLVKGWEQSYINSEENALMYQFKLPGKPKTDMRVLHSDGKLTSYSHTRGAMIFVTRKVLDTVGGFDTGFGLAYFEHPNYIDRIHNAGLTTHRAMDVVGSDKLLYCLDQDAKVESSIPSQVRKDALLHNLRYYRSQRNSKEFKAYK